MHEDSCQIKLHLETHIDLNSGEQVLMILIFALQQQYKISETREPKVVLTLALLMVGDHHSVKRRLGIWLRPDLWALVSFFHFMDSSKPLAFSL